MAGTIQMLTVMRIKLITHIVLVDLEAVKYIIPSQIRLHRLISQIIELGPLSRAPPLSVMCIIGVSC